MKTFKINSLRTIVNVSIVTLLLSFSCAQSGSQSDRDTSSTAEIASKVETPKMDIQMAVISNDIAAVKQHIAAGTDLNEKDAMSGSTPLITAASFGKTAIAKALIDAGADLSLKNNDGATALHTAAFFCRTEIVQVLIEANSDKSLKNNYGMTPRETIIGPFEPMKPIYQMLQQQLQPMGMKIDLRHIEKTRPIIAELLK